MLTFLKDWQTNIHTKWNVWRGIKSLPNHAHILYFKPDIEISLFEGFWQFLTDWRTDRGSYSYNKMANDNLRVYPTLLISFVSSSMSNFLCLRLFWQFFEIFLTDRPTDRPKHLILEAPSPELKNHCWLWN